MLKKGAGSIADVGAIGGMEKIGAAARNDETLCIPKNLLTRPEGLPGFYVFEDTSWNNCLVDPQIELRMHAGSAIIGIHVFGRRVNACPWIGK
jgi:hypothetical protein